MREVAATQNEKLVALRVIDQQEPLVFLLKSKSRPLTVIHRVDLEEYWHSGKCTCETFEMRIEPLLRRKLIDPNTRRAWCEHIKRAREVVAEAAITAVAKHGERQRAADPKSDPKWWRSAAA